MTAAWPAELVPMGLRGGVVHLVHLEDREPVRAICVHALVARLEPVTTGDARLCRRCAQALPVYRDDWLPRQREAALWREIMQGVREMAQRVADIRTDIEGIGERLAAEEHGRRSMPARRGHRHRCR
jgi:hypothetical protein